MDLIISFVLGFFVSSYLSRKKISDFEREMQKRFEDKEKMYLTLLEQRSSQSRIESVAVPSKSAAAAVMTPESILEELKKCICPSSSMPASDISEVE